MSKSSLHLYKSVLLILDGFANCVISFERAAISSSSAFWFAAWSASRLSSSSCNFWKNLASKVNGTSTLVMSEELDDGSFDRILQGKSVTLPNLCSRRSRQVTTSQVHSLLWSGKEKTKWIVITYSSSGFSSLEVSTPLLTFPLPRCCETRFSRWVLVSGESVASIASPFRRYMVSFGWNERVSPMCIVLELIDIDVRISHTHHRNHTQKPRRCHC